MNDDERDTIPPTAAEHAVTPAEMRSSYPAGVRRPDIDRALNSLERVRDIVSDENEKQTKRQVRWLAGAICALVTLAAVTGWSAIDIRQRVNVLRDDVEHRIEALEKRVERLEKP